MRVLVADVVTNRGANSWNWIRLDFDGNVLKAVDGPNAGKTFQQPGDGSFKYDTVSNPGLWERCKQSNGQFVWGTGFSRLYVELP